MIKKPYKEHIKFLAHLHKDEIDQITSPSFYYYNPQWPAFVLKASDHYQHPVRKVVDDLASYRNSFTFQKDRTAFVALIAAEGEAA